LATDPFGPVTPGDQVLRSADNGLRHGGAAVAEHELARPAGVADGQPLSAEEEVKRSR